MNISKKSLTHNISLILFNALLIVIAIFSSLFYSKNVSDNQNKNNLNDFKTNIETMKQVSSNYLNSENGYVLNWANYITSSKMSLNEALSFLRNINTNKKRFAHIIDVSTFDAYSSYKDVGDEYIDDYKKYYGDNLSEFERDFSKKINIMFSDNSTKFYVLGKYLISENDQFAISVGKRITLYNEDLSTKDYLLLRVIPVSDVKNTWVFPINYKNNGAEVGIITSNGDYVIESDSMKSSNFLEYIRAYNFQDNYNKVDDLKEELLNSQNGILKYKNYRNQDCIWYYSRLDDDLELDIVGVINKDALSVDNSNSWLIASVICGTLLVLIIVDGIYLAYINKKLRISASLANKANQSKTMFLSSMSHDMRTPLNAILGLTYLARINKNDPKYVDDCLSKATSAGKELLTLINDVLDMSKIENDKLHINMAVTSLSKLFLELKEIIEPEALLKKINLEWNINLNENIYALTDKLRLQQICLNLLSNSIKYTNSNGNVLFSVDECVNENTIDLIITVKDNGIGMSEEFQKNMYKSFEREVSTRVNKTQGSGLGLYIVKHTVDAMKGKIECESIQNEGTCFKVYLTLDIASNEEEIAIKENNDYSLIEGMHVLIAEDNNLNAHILKTMLENNKISCDIVSNGLLCKNKLFEEAPGYYDAILMDVHMPVMNGLEATKIIRSEGRDGRGNIPIIALTADVFEENVKECISSGMNMHITKPIDIKKLYDALMSLKR